MTTVKNIVFIGAGNVATQLALALHKKEYNILQVYSRTKRSALALAAEVKASPITRLSEITKDADIFIVSVADHALPKFSVQLYKKNGLVVHTSGFHSIDVLKGVSARCGVLYPLQTFSKEITVDFNKIPFCIEAKNKKDEKILKQLAGKLSSEVRIMNSESRKILHLAAVFACNYSNYMYCVAAEILKEKKIPFKILLPLIKETAAKAVSTCPCETQTGPARRGDRKVLNQHMKMIKDEDRRKLYKIISKQICKKYNS